MRKKTMFLLLAFLMMNSYIPGIPSETPQTTFPWEELHDTLQGMNVRFLNAAHSKNRYIPCPSTIPVEDTTETIEYFITTTTIQKALEQSLELDDKASKLIIHLGTFTPQQKKDAGETHEKKVTWDLPEFHPVHVNREMLRQLINEKTRQNTTLVEREFAALAIKNASKQTKTEALVTYLFPFDYAKREYGELDQLLMKGKRKEAVRYCSRLTGKVQRECYRILADALVKKDIKKWISESKHEKVENYCYKRDGELRLQCFRIAADAYSKQKEYERAIRYFEKTGFKECMNRIGEVYFTLGNYKKAADYFEKGNHSIRRAKAYGTLADQYHKQGDNTQAKTYYKKAVAEYEWLIKSYDYQWDDIENLDRLRYRRAVAAYEKSAEEIARQKKLDKILAKTAAYCQQVRTALIHFFCKEVIREVFKKRDGTLRNSFVYEYQLIKEKDKITERRILLDRNGEKFRQEDAPLGTSKFKYEYLIYGPIAFFSKSLQEYYDYKIIKEEVLNGRKTIVLEVVPLRRGEEKMLCGSVWLDAEDGNFSILKIQWHPKFLIKNFHVAIESAWRQNAELYIDYFSQFNIEKNGIRFPGKYWIKEYHINEKGKKKLQASMVVDFKDYRFFSVATEVTYQE
jgi:tetratricopeptide (TPR) repeat protein